MKELDKIKVFFVTVFTAANSWLGALAIPFYILVGTNVIDYATGILAAAYRGEKVSSEVGFHGIAKKICMWLLVLVGYIVDYIIISMGQTMNISIGFKCIVSIAVVFWLLANELISILENIHDIGVPMPHFLLKLVKYIKDTVEETVDGDGTNEKDTLKE